MLVLLFLFLLLANYLQMMFGGVHYYDEAITIMGLFFIIYFRHDMKELDGNFRKMMVFILLILTIGTISTARYHIQPQFAGVWRDALAISKFPICYYAYSLYSQHINLNNINKQVVPLAKVFICICFILGLFTYCFRDSFGGILYRGERYGFPLYHMGFSHNTFLIAVVIMNMAVLIANGFKKNMSLVLLGAFCVVLTMRSKPMFVLVFLAAVWYLRERNKSFRITKMNIICYSVLIILLTFFLISSQLNDYIGYGENAARGACYYYGVDIANNHFPLGSGFCTFSSSLSGTYYSPLYYEYGLSEMEGLTPENYNYAADTFWPNIYSQYGWIGLVFYLFMLYHMLQTINRRFILLSDQWVAGMLLLLYCISAAFAESIYTNSTAIDYALILALFIGKNNENCSANSIPLIWRRRKIHC